MPRYLWIFLHASVLAAQPFSVGVKGGVRLTPDLDPYWATSESKRYIAGPTIGVGLPKGFTLDLTALYCRVGFRVISSDILGGYYSSREVGTLGSSRS
jgi:hypothetical protein